jgi:hypothetical protein
VVALKSCGVLVATVTAGELVAALAEAARVAHLSVEIPAAVRVGEGVVVAGVQAEKRKSGHQAAPPLVFSRARTV